MTEPVKLGSLAPAPTPPPPVSFHVDRGQKKVEGEEREKLGEKCPHTVNMKINFVMWARGLI